MAYQSLLTRRYLLSRLMPVLSSLSVAMCTAMVLVIWSIMGGFLSQFIASSRTMLGDAYIERPTVGIPHYEELLAEIREDPVIAAAAPTLSTVGLLTLPGGELRTVEVLGVEADSYDAVTGYASWLTRGDESDAGRTLTPPSGVSEDDVPAIVLGDRIGRESAAATPLEMAPGDAIVLSVLPLSEDAEATLAAERFVLADTILTGRQDIDAGRVLLPLSVLQRSLGYERSTRVMGEETFIAPARVTSILVRASEGATPEDAAARLQVIYGAYAERHSGRVPTLSEMVENNYINTWDQRRWQRMYIGEVKKQIALLLALFSFISLTASFLVFSVLWSMVSEKTRDIGVLRSLGATRMGVTQLFLLYGGAIGLVGALLGGGLAWLIVANINPIHDRLTDLLGFVLWDPDVYYFSRIPDRIDPLHAGLVLAGGVVLSLIGALLPAIRAARMDPARALQFE